MVVVAPSSAAGLARTVAWSSAAAAAALALTAVSPSAADFGLVLTSHVVPVFSYAATGTAEVLSAVASQSAPVSDNMLL